MFLFFFSVLAYYVFQNDPPVVFAYSSDDTVKNLKDLSELFTKFKETTNNLLIFTTNSSAVLRKGQIASSLSGCKDNSNLYVFPNSTDLQLFYNFDKATIETIEPTDVCSKLEGPPTNSLIIFVEGNTTYPKVGYSNPFTPGVWNCFFMIILCIAFIIWSMIHYSNIAVQENFAKKIN